MSWIRERLCDAYGNWYGLTETTSMVRDAFGNHRDMLNLRLVFWTVAVLGLLFQVGHLFEHAFQLRSRWRTAFRRQPPPHLPRHVLFRVLAYRLQADQLGDLDAESQRLLDRSDSPEGAGRIAVNLNQRSAELRPGTVLAREWNGQMQRVAVLADGFAWNGKTYPSLSKIAFTITGTRWSGPKFFGLQVKSSKGASQ